MDLYSRNSNQRCDTKKLGESWTYTRETPISGMIKKKKIRDEQARKYFKTCPICEVSHRHKGPRTVA